MAATKRLIPVLADNSGTLYECRYEGGGQVPDYLKGKVFTSRAWAQMAINSYLANHKRGAANGKATS